MGRLLSAFVGVALVWPAALGCPSVAAQEGGAAWAGDANSGVAAWLNRIDQDFSRDIVRRLAQPPAGPAGTRIAQKAETRPGAPGEVRSDAGADPARTRVLYIGEWAGKVQDWLARAASAYQGKVMRPLSAPGSETPPQSEVAGLSAEASAKLKRDLMERQRYDGDEADVQRAEAEKRAADTQRREMEESLRRDLIDRKKYDLGLIGQPKPGEGQRPAAVAQELQEQTKRDLAERRRQEEEAEARKAAEAKAAEQKRVAAEAEARRKAEEQAAAAKAAEEKRLAAEAEAKRKVEEQVAAAKAAEEKRLAAEAEAKRKAEEQAAAVKAAEQKRVAAEAEAKRKTEEQAAAAAKAAEKKQVADAADAAKRAAEEKAVAPKPVDPAKRWIEAETMRRSAEQKAKEADRKKAADEAEAKRKADEAEAKRKAEEGAAREAAAKRAAEEAEVRRKADAARMAAEASKLGDEVLARGKTAAAPAAKARKVQPAVEEGSTDKEPARAASASSGSKGKRAVRQARAERREGRCRNAGRKVKPPATYVVARGDTLWDISELHYRSGARYPIIYRANRSKIADPDLIYPCQRLFLPARRR